MKNIAKRAISLLLALAIILGISPVWQLTADAATGDRKDTETLYTIDTNDYISLPIEIYDYMNDGMLFEFASSNSRRARQIRFISPEIEHGWNFTEGTYACKDVPAINAKTGYNSLKINGNFSFLGTHNGREDATILNDNDTYLTALRAYRSTGSSSFSSSNKGSIPNNVENELLTLGDLGGIQAQYMVLGYWYESADNTNNDGVFLFNRTAYNGKPTVLGSTRTNLDNINKISTWNEVLYDMGSLQTLNIVSINPVAASCDFYISHVAFFDTKEKAEAFMTASEYRNYAAYEDNHAFGFVGGSRGNAAEYDTSALNRNFPRIGSKWSTTNKTYYVDDSDPAESTKILTLGPEASDQIPLATKTALGYELFATMADNTNGNASATLGLLNHSLGKNGLPTYVDDAVTYIAELLEYTLNIPEKNSNGYYNYNYVSGAENDAMYGLREDGTPSDLADAIRRAVKKTASDVRMGSLSDTKKKHNDLVGVSAKTVFKDGHITTYMDAAYYLLNNLFVANAYSEPYNAYDTMRLAGVDENNDGISDYYVFDAGLSKSKGGESATEYDEVNRVIYNSASPYKAYSSMDSSNSMYTTTFPFLPMLQKNNEAGDTDIPYWLDDGANNIAGVFNTYDERNYNFVMKSEGQFIYERDKDLFFEFEGDDDVYLFINGELVLDLGGGHPIATQKIKINDYVTAAESVDDANATDRDKALRLEDGKAYPFHFFYMERKGFGANLKVMTNIKVTSTEIGGNKYAMQGDNVLSMGSPISYTTPVHYLFSVTNNGDDPINSNGNNLQDNALINLVFKDRELGITLSHDSDSIIKSGGLSARVKDVNGYDLEYKDLTFVLTDKENKEISRCTPKTPTEYKNWLALPGGTGVEVGCTLTIYGTYIQLYESDFLPTGLFTNHLDISCVSDGGEFLTAAGLFQLRHVEAITYYQWAGHPVTVSKEELAAYINSAITFNESEGYYKIKTITDMYVCDRFGTEDSSSDLTIDDSLNLIIHHNSAGNCLEYIRVNYTDVNGETGKPITVPIATNVFETKDDVFVLDYGLTVDLSNGDTLIDKDSMTNIVGNTNVVEGMSVLHPDYIDGIGGNHIVFYTPADNAADTDPLVGDFYITVRAEEIQKRGRMQVIDPSVKDATYTLNSKLLDVGEKITASQMFRIRYIKTDIDSADPNGTNQVKYYTIQSCMNGKYLTAGSTHFSNITMTGYSGADNQLWSIVETDTLTDYQTTQSLNYYSIYSKASGTSSNGVSPCTMVIASPTLTTEGDKAVPVGTTRYVGTNQPSLSGPESPDYITVVGRTQNAQKWTFRSIDTKSNFAYADNSLFYRPDSFMEDAESVYVAVRAYKNGTTPSAIGVTNVKTEVEMYKKVTVLPANVVYYEDDFPAIYYNTANTGNVIISDGTGLATSTEAEDLFVDFNDDSIPVQSVWTQATDIKIADGALTYTVGDTKHNLYLSGGYKTPGTLNFAPTKDMYCQIRFKVDGATVDDTNSNTDGAGNIQCSLSAINSSGTPIDYNLRNIPFENVDGKYYIYTFNLSNVWTTVKPVTGLNLTFNYITPGAKVTVDYVFVGNAADLPVKGWETLMQDNDQDTPYGSDSHYQDATNDYSGTGYHKIQITQKTSIAKSLPDAYFTFAGTGFELIGRTNASDSANILIRVKKEDGTPVKMIPVITEFDHDYNSGSGAHDEELYQVPMVKVNDLDFGTYKVEITGMTSYVYDENGKAVYDDNGNKVIKETYIYIDGIRIYNPLGDSTLTGDYNASEKDAQFKEIRELIMANQLAAVKLVGEGLDANMSEYGYTENRIGVAYDTESNYEGYASKINDYVLAGPNNELYLSSESNKQGIAMYVKDADGDSETKGSLQIAMRLIDYNQYYGGATEKGENAAKVYLGTGTVDNPTWVAIDDALISGTEQYYNIDLSLCPKVKLGDNEYIQVVIALSPDSLEGACTIVSFTNIKYSGIEFKDNINPNIGSVIRFNEKGLVEVQQSDSNTAQMIPGDSSIMTVSEETSDSEWIELSAEESEKYMRLDLIGEQMRSTTVIDPALANRNGVYEVDGELYYFVDGEIYTSVGLIELAGRYYYVRSNGKVAIGNYWVTNTNGLMEQGFYTFQSNGAMLLNDGIVDVDGTLYYYDNNNLQYGAGLIMLNGKYYYIRTGGQVAVGNYWVTKTNGLMPEGMYTFREDGSMLLLNGIVDVDGTLYYYVNNSIQYGAGLIELDGNYYYIRSGGQVAIGKYWVTRTNGLMPEGFYTFLEDGSMRWRNGIVEEDGALYYYVNDVLQAGAGLIQLDGNFYYIRSNGQAAVGKYWVTNTNGLMDEGLYTFDEDGRMIL